MPKTADLPSRRPHMDAGNIRPWIEQYVSYLVGLGHTPLTVNGYSEPARHFAHWTCQSGVALSDVDDGTIEQFAQHKCQCPGGRHLHCVSKRYMYRVRDFIRFLAQAGIVPGPALPPAGPTVAPVVTEFLEWLRKHRGLSERTIGFRGQVINRLLPALGPDPAAYDAGRVRQVVLDEARRSSSAYVRAMTTTLRGYLRFLAARGACSPWLDQAVPTVPHWRLSALPRYLPMADVERLIASCDRASPSGIRDKAILLLLARLGLRAGDILAMRLSNVDWKDGTIRVSGKGRREVCLPLPQDAGDALLYYVTRVRQSVVHDQIFLRSLAPFRPVRQISSVVELGLKRAGIANAPSRGARLLRHSAATGMLRAGATLDAIGAVLRHRSPDTTMLYAKVDTGMLGAIAQPWPGDIPC